MSRFQQIDDAIKADIKGYELVLKHESKLMAFINIFVKIFNERFMDHYTVTFAPKIYVPEKHVRSDMFWKTLAHEWVHLVTARNNTTLINSFFYGLPQILAPLALVSLGAIWGSPWFLLNLLWLLCLAPIPAYFRMKEEMEAYAMSMACNYWRYGSITNTQIEWIAKHFTGPDYYFMWPFEGNVRDRLDTLAHKVQNGEFDNKHPFDKVKKIIEVKNA